MMRVNKMVRGVAMITVAMFAWMLLAPDIVSAKTGIEEENPSLVTKTAATAKKSGGTVKRRFPWLWIVVAVVAATGGVWWLAKKKTNYEFSLLEFPFANWRKIKRIAAFGVPNWSDDQPHNGIDLIVDSEAVIVSPTVGTVSAIEVSENSFSHPAGQIMVKVEIYINSQRTVTLNFEAGTIDPGTKARQIAAIAVKKGDHVSIGSMIGTLIVGEQGYTHLHYMLNAGGKNQMLCPYAYSSAAARQIFETLRDTLPNNHLPDGRICFGQQ